MEITATAAITRLPLMSNRSTAIHGASTISAENTKNVRSNAGDTIQIGFAARSDTAPAAGFNPTTPGLYQLLTTSSSR